MIQKDIVSSQRDNKLFHKNFRKVLKTQSFKGFSLFATN